MSSASRRASWRAIESGAESNIRIATYTASSSRRMRASVRCDAGAPVVGTVWVKSRATSARDHASSSMRPSMRGGVVARAAATRGRASPFAGCWAAAVEAKDERSAATSATAARRRDERGCMRKAGNLVTRLTSRARVRSVSASFYHPAARRASPGSRARAWRTHEDTMPSSRSQGHRGAAGGALLIPLLLGLALPTPVEAIPAFARKYGVSCSLCHSPFPRLNAFGESFAANGFEFSPTEQPRDTINTGDRLLRLQRNLPLAVRFDAYLQALGRKYNGQTVTNDLMTPWTIKLLSGGQVADKISYYMYFFFSERGEVAGLEDAYLQFTDIAGSGLSVIAGQFQLSDPLFKRELRLQYEDYQPYRVRVGEVKADLTYDRGLMALYSPWKGGDL